MGVRTGWIGGGYKSGPVPDNFPVIVNGVYQIPPDTFFDPAAAYLAFTWRPGPEDEPELQDRGDGYGFPWGVDLPVLMRWLTQIKTWHLSLDINFSYSVEHTPGHPEDGYDWESGFAHIEFDYSFKVTPGIWIFDERANPDGFLPMIEPHIWGAQGFGNPRLLVSGDGDYEQLHSENPSYPNLATLDPEISNVEASIDPTVPDSDGISIELTQGRFGGFIDDEFWPLIEITINGQFNTARSAYNGVSPDDPLSEFKGNLNLEDNSTTIYGTPTFTPSDTDLIFIDSADATISAQKFWPYANTAGSPVYDEDTGDELVDPFS